MPQLLFRPSRKLQLLCGSGRSAFLGDVLGNSLPRKVFSRLRNHCAAFEWCRKILAYFCSSCERVAKVLCSSVSGLMDGFRFCTLLIENFQVLFKAGVHIVRVDVSSINGGQIAVHRIGNVIVRVISPPSGFGVNGSL